MSRARTITLFISAAFIIIGIHQTITIGFEVSYWIFMLALSLYFLSRLLSGQEKEKKENKVSSKKRKRPQGNRQSKRFLNRTK